MTTNCKNSSLRGMHRLAVAGFLLAAAGCRSAAERAAEPPRPGRWDASAESLGGFVFEVAADGGTVTLTSFHFKQFMCGSGAEGGGWIHGDWRPDTDNSGTVSAGRFSIHPEVSGRYVLTYGGEWTDFSLFDAITVQGAFDDSGERAEGSWKVVWGDAVCSGNWESPEAAPPSTAAETAATPVAPVRRGGGFTDSFDDNANGWFVDDYRDPFVAGSRFIAGGKYRWEVRSFQPSRFSSIPEMDPVSDFYVIVDAQRVSGPAGCMYGLLFRRLDRNNFYSFWITDEQTFAFERVDQDEWFTLIDWTQSAAIHPGGVNRLAVRGKGSHFEFFLNDTFVGGADDDEFSSGIVGLVVGFPEGGSEAVFEFDDFERGALWEAR